MHKHKCFKSIMKSPNAAVQYKNRQILPPILNNNEDRHIDDSNDIQKFSDNVQSKPTSLINLIKSDAVDDLRTLVDAIVTDDLMSQDNPYKVGSKTKFYSSESSEKSSESFRDKLSKPKQNTHSTEDLNPLDAILRLFDYD